MNNTDIFLKHLTSACDKIGKLLKYNSDKTIFDETVVNASGDMVKKIDVLCHNIFEEEFRNCSLVGGIASEELDEPVIWNENGLYVLIIDPLDGSLSANLNITVGSIFTIYKSNGKITKETFLQNGSKIFCAGYSLYGPSTSLIFAHKNKATQYQILNGELKKYKDKLTILDNFYDGIFSMNASNYFRWDKKDQQLYAELISNFKVFRYVGSLVAEVQRTIMSGGFYAYPKDSKNTNGRLRLVYECIPMAYIIKCAGGLCGNGEKSLLDVKPKELHEKSPIYFGSYSVVSNRNLL